jgi:hypothetical protein
MICTKTENGTYSITEITGEELTLLQELFAAEYHRTPELMKEFRTKMRNWHLAVDDEITSFLIQKIQTNHYESAKIHKSGE